MLRLSSFEPTGFGSAASYLCEAGAEAVEHFLHVASLLHGDDPEVVLLVDPHQEGLALVVPEETEPCHSTELRGNPDPRLLTGRDFIYVMVQQKYSTFMKKTCMNDKA